MSTQPPKPEAPSPPRSCRFFDRTGCGYLKTDDLRRLLHSLGLALPNRTVRELVAGVADQSGRYKGERVYYRDITDKEKATDK